MIKRLVLPIASVLALGCSGAQEDVAAVQGAHTLHVRSAISAADDVAGMRFDVTPVDCGKKDAKGPSVTEVHPLEGFLPGGIADLEDAPLDRKSAHAFADAFMVLPPGCYDVSTTPLNPKGDPSAVCYAARKTAVPVVAGETTEVILINQCRGADVGGLDVIGVLNHEPQLLDVNFERSKFVTCGVSQRICATVRDVDHDPLEFVWTLSKTAPAATGPTVVSRAEERNGDITECVEYLPLEAGRFDVNLTVYDLMWAKETLIRIEDGTEEHHHSRAELNFFFYVSPTTMASATGAPSGPAAPAPTAPAVAPTLAEVLILDSTVSGGASSVEAEEVRALGLLPRLVDEATWSTMSAGDFAQFRAVVLGDPSCGRISSAATDNAAVWGSAVTGNVLVNGTDPVFHDGQGGRKLTRAGLTFATADAAKTGAYISLSCAFDGAGALTPVPMLAGMGAFTVTSASCHNDAHIVATHPAVATLTDTDLSDWSCSVHEAFDTWPSDFEVLALARNAGGAFTAGDGSVGTPYILARGVITVGCGNGTLNPGEECDDGNNTSGDGCDLSCNLERPTKPVCAPPVKDPPVKDPPVKDPPVKDPPVEDPKPEDPKPHT